MSNLKSKMKNVFLLIIFFVLASLFVRDTWAQEKMAITITPPLIKNNVSPGQIWKSYIKVVNNNAQPIEIYTELINFEAGNESGTVKLTPKSAEEIKNNNLLINNWVKIEDGPIEIPAFKSKEIPFIVDVPDNANPGDHHLAILIGTEPNKTREKGSSIKVSSKIGSLLLLNVGGDVRESGIVREFLSDKKLYSEGQVNFNLRFQNTGNTILQPRGEIKIYNWQEKNLESIEINHKTNAGNIFPKDTRLWKYSWEVPTSFLKMGRYKAEMFLTYGSQSKETAERTIYFWVLQWKPILIGFITIIILGLLIVWLVRRSIKKAVLNTQKQIGLYEPVNQTKTTAVVRRKRVAKKIKKQPGVVDLKTSSKIKKKHDG